MRPRRRHTARPRSSGGGTPPAGPQTVAVKARSAWGTSCHTSRVYVGGGRPRGGGGRLASQWTLPLHCPACCQATPYVSRVQ